MKSALLLGGTIFVVMTLMGYTADNTATFGNYEAPGDVWRNWLSLGFGALLALVNTVAPKAVPYLRDVLNFIGGKAGVDVPDDEVQHAIEVLIRHFNGDTSKANAAMQAFATYRSTVGPTGKGET